VSKLLCHTRALAVVGRGAVRVPQRCCTARYLCFLCTLVQLNCSAFVCSAVRTAQHASLRVQRTPLRRNRVTSSALQKEKQMDQSRTSHRHPGSGGRVPHRKR